MRSCARSLIPVNVWRDLLIEDSPCPQKGDKVYVSNLLSDIDETHFSNAWEVDFRRNEGEHAGFGAGPHHCLEQLLALLKIRVFLEEWLKRIPDFAASKSDTPRFGPGQVNCISRLVLEWTHDSELDGI